MTSPTLTDSSLFQAAQAQNAPAPNEYVVGTITDHQLVHYRYGEAMSFDLIDLELDTPFLGNTKVRGIIAVTPRGYDIPGHRIRGQMFLSEDHLKELKRPNIPGWLNMYRFMREDGRPFMDLRTTHMAADDHRTMATGNPYRTGLDITGHYDPKWDDYYITHGYDMNRIHADSDARRNRDIGFFENLAHRFNLNGFLPKTQKPSAPYPMLPLESPARTKTPKPEQPQ